MHDMAGTAVAEVQLGRTGLLEASQVITPPSESLSDMLYEMAALPNYKGSFAEMTFQPLNTREVELHNFGRFLIVNLARWDARFLLTRPGLDELRVNNQLLSKIRNWFSIRRLVDVKVAPSMWIQPELVSINPRHDELLGCILEFGVVVHNKRGIWRCEVICPPSVSDDFVIRRSRPQLLDKFEKWLMSEAL